MKEILVESFNEWLVLGVIKVLFLAVNSVMHGEFYGKMPVKFQNRFKLSWNISKNAKKRLLVKLKESSALLT